MNVNSIHTAILDPVGVKAGMDQYDMRLATALQLQGVNVSILSNFNGNGVVKFFSSSVVAGLFSYLQLIFAYRKAIEFCDANTVKQAILHVFGFTRTDRWVISQFQRRGIRVVLIVHDVESFVYKNTMDRTRAILLQCKDSIIVHHKSAAAEILRLVGNDVPVNVLPHGHFISEQPVVYEKRMAREKLGIPISDFCPLFFGMIKPTKGLSVLLDAMELVGSNYHVLVAGRPRGDVRSQLEGLVKLQKKGRATFSIGYITEDEMELWFLAADCIVLPYERIYQSGVALQAMSRKVPVLMSDLPAHAEWHHAGADATLFQAGDSVDLALKLQWMQHNLVEIAQRADRAYQHLVKYHDWKILASGIVNLSAVG